MTELRRNMIFRTVDGKQELFMIMAHWHKMRRCDEVLDWCIQNKITGKNLYDFINKLTAGGVLSSYQYICMRIDREKAPRPIIAGKDYL